jgi:four helix bundle protein
MDLVDEVYRLTASYPKTEQYILISQIRRSAVSVPSNIAEGHIRSHDNEFRQFLYVALGSLAELETQLQISLR